MYRIRYAATLLILICFLAASAQAAQMSVDPLYQRTSNGSVITVDITVDPEELSVYSASYTLRFNNTLLYATSQVKGLFLTPDGADYMIIVNNIDNAAGRIEYSESRWDTSVEVTAPGVLTTITFEVIGEEGISTLNISKYANALLHSHTHGFILPDLNNGSVKVKEGVCGDVTGDGTVNMADVTKLLWNQTYWGQYPVDPCAADVTGGGGVNMGDVTKLLWNQTYWGQYPLTCC